MPGTNATEFAQKYRQRILTASSASAGLGTYIPGDDIDGNELRSFADEPIICGPLVCQLCDKDFINAKAFADHKKNAHAGESEYRKRVLFLMSEQGCKPITAQEKRLMVQNYAHFQQYCYPGAKGNYFADGEEVPRCEAACAICARKDWLEHRHKLRLFANMPSGVVSEDAEADLDSTNDFREDDGGAAQPAAKLKRHGEYYIQSPEQLHKHLDVNRYIQRWPLIPAQELHASSVQHPHHQEWRWLLHTRRVPMLNTQAISSTTDSLPACAGVGDPDAHVWVCWDCLSDVCAKKPALPLNGLTNDNWIGREKPYVRAASRALKMLASIGRCCWKQIRLGKGAPDVQQKGIVGNTIFFAQPTADIPSMDLPPPVNALVDSISIIFTRSLQCLKNAWWATVNRAEYWLGIRKKKASGEHRRTRRTRRTRPTRRT